MNNAVRAFFRLSYRTNSIIILLLLACGPMPFDYDEFKSFFAPESAKNETQFHYYNFSSQFLYHSSDYWEKGSGIDLSQKENTRAWALYTGASEKIVTNELYPKFNNADNHYPPKRTTTDNLELTLFLRKRNTEASDYLDFAKKIEAADLNNSSDYVYDPTLSRNNQEYEDWLKHIQWEYKQTNDIFLKERWAYQAVKVADMAGNPKKSIRLYKKLVEPLPQKTFISDWARSRMAGACMHAKDSVQAYYHFSQLFVTAPTRRLAAFLCLDNYSPDLYKEALKLCKNNREKANVYASTAVQPLQDALPMLKQIRKLDVNNPMLEFVTAREINKNEQFFFSDWENLNYSYEYFEKLDRETLKVEAPRYFNKLLAFSLESAQNHVLKKSPFWYTAAAYLTYIAKDYKKSKELLQKAKAIPNKDKGIQDQIAMQEMIVAITESPTVTPELEQKIIPFLERFARSDQFRIANNFNAACKILATKYRRLPTTNEFSEGSKERTTTSTINRFIIKQKENKSSGWLSGCSRKKDYSLLEKTALKKKVSNSEENTTPEDKAKSFILSILASYQLGYIPQTDDYDWLRKPTFESNTNQYAIEDSTSSEVINYVISYFNKKSPTDFDRRLIKLTRLDNAYLYLVLGRRALSEHRYAEAKEAWSHIPTKVWAEEPFKTYLDVNPFHLQGQGDANAKQRITPLIFATRMAQLQDNINKNPNDYESLIILGCGSYNMSYYGNSWILLRRGRTSSEQTNEADDYYNANKALFYFDKAIMVAPNGESGAKACYLASICQRISFDFIEEEVSYGHYDFIGEEHDKKKQEVKEALQTLRKEKYSTYFNLLKTKYRQTDYENQLIRECSTYKDFLAGK